MFGSTGNVRDDLAAMLDEAIDKYIKPMISAVKDTCQNAVSAVKNTATSLTESAKDTLGLNDKSESHGLEKTRGIGLSATRGPNLPEQNVVANEVGAPERAAYAQIDGMNLKNCLGDSGVVCDAPKQQAVAMDLGAFAAPAAVNFTQHQQQQQAGLGMA